MKYKFTEDWTSQNLQVWSAVLIPFAHQPLNFIELGCFEGRATTWLLENVLIDPKSSIDCVDIWNGRIENIENHHTIDWKQVEENFRHNVTPFGDKVRIHKEDTAIYLKKRTELADIIYIDAGHEMCEAITDGVLSHLLLKHNGLLIFDDYLWTKLESNPHTPKGAIDAFINCFSDQYDLVSFGYQVILQKR